MAVTVSRGHGDLDLDQVVEAIAAKKAAWRQLSAQAKLDLLLRVQAQIERHLDDWVDNSVRLRGVEGPAPYLASSLAVINVGLTGTLVSSYIRSFRHLAQTGSFPAPPKLRTRADGQKVATVFPADLLERLFGPGVTGELWLTPGATGTQGASYRDSPGGLTAILGPGNYEATQDILTKMFAENKVVVYKANPVNTTNVGPLRKVFGPLIEGGFLAIVEGGALEGEALVSHSAVDDVLMTGSAATYDRIVWGPPEQQAANKRSGHKLMTKPFHAELGGPNPVLVVPGEWTPKQLDHQAAQIVAAKLINGSHICVSPQLFIVDRAWPQRGQLLDRIRRYLAQAPAAVSYYPRAAETQALFQQSYAEAELIDPPEKKLATELPRLLIPDVDKASLVTQREAFCPVLAEVRLDGGSPQAFLDAAVDYCNQELYGSLAAMLLVTPRAAKELGERLDDHIAKLRYGLIGVNAWPGLIGCYGALSWGSHPGHTPEDIQSGMGIVGNGFLLDGVQKSVLRTPIFHPTHPQLPHPRDRVLTDRVTRHLVHPTPKSLLKVVRGLLLGR